MRLLCSVPKLKLDGTARVDDDIFTTFATSRFFATCRLRVKDSSEASYSRLSRQEMSVEAGLPILVFASVNWRHFEFESIHIHACSHIYFLALRCNPGVAHSSKKFFFNSVKVQDSVHTLWTCYLPCTSGICVCLVVLLLKPIDYCRLTLLFFYL